MRAAILVLLLLLPLTSGWPVAPPEQPEFDSQIAWPQERLLVNHGGVWTTGAWDQLLELGVQPLRSVRADALLVWQTETVAYPGGVTAEAFNDAAYLTPLSGLGPEAGPIRAVFEPRLPFSHIAKMGQEVVALGGEVSDLRTGFGSLPASFVVSGLPALSVDELLETPGILWLEPVLQATARNGQAASLLQTGTFGQQPFWNLGIDGTGIVLGVADSGLDADHACFRNATTANTPHAEPEAEFPAVGVFGNDHRKIITLNTTLDDNDTPGHSDYRHGTHVIGSLACHDVHDARSGDLPGNGSSVAYAAKLVVQDIVSAEGWVPPEVDRLLWEASTHGAVIHSNSWGDDTTAYTERTGRFDAYARAMPWSTAFIAPGNSGEGILEPANGRNVVAVGATTKASQPQRWASSSYGPTEAGTDGVFTLAPGVSIQSAAADGFWSSNNDNLRSSSGTSMATPLAASTAALIQQLYEDGWLHGPNEPLALTPLATPVWSTNAGPSELLLGEGFTPSGPLLRATMALAASPLGPDERNGGSTTHALHNPYDGWGVLNLERLLNTASLVNGTSPATSLWIHDSYRLQATDVSAWFSQHGSATSNLSGLAQQTWNGSGAQGPFLQTGDVFRQRFTPLAGEDITVRMAFPAQPAPAMVDDLQLRVVLENGKVVLPDRVNSDGTPTQFNRSVANFNDTNMFPNTNETTLGINVPAELLANASWFDVEVVARYVQPGGAPGAVGLDGDAVGFALIVQGVDRDSTDHEDGDGDGVVNAHDACPNEDARGHDQDGDGCLDDTDGDGVTDNVDECLTENSTGFDINGDGCLDDTDGDGVTDDVDECMTADLDWPVTDRGCYPTDRPPEIEIRSAPANNTSLSGQVEVGWKVTDADLDGFLLRLDVVFADANASAILSCENASTAPAEGVCTWTVPDDLAPYYIKGARYTMRATLVSTNASPAGMREPVVVVVVDDLLLPNDPVISTEATTEQGTLSLIWAVFLGVLAGVVFARYRGSVRQRDEQGSPAPPFRGEGDNESEETRW